MGAITRIRQVSPYFLGFVAALFIAFMVIQDSSFTTLSQSGNSAESKEIATVNGESISMADYERRVRDVLELQRQQNPNQEVDDETIRQQVFDEMVNELLRKQQAAKMGIVVTPQQLIDVMMINPPEQLQLFKDSTGRFDIKRQQELISNPDRLGELLAQQNMPDEEVQRQVQQWKQTIFQIEDNVRSMQLQQTLAATVGASASVPSIAAAEVQYRTDNGTADIEFAALSIDRVPDNAVPVSDDEIKAYYEKNKEFYTQKRSRALKYMIFPQIASSKDTANAMKQSQRVAETLGALTTPQQKDSAFSAMMAMYSGQTTDFVTVNQIDPNSVTVLNSLAQGEVFGPLTTPSGITYFRLDGRRDGVNPVVRASHILIPFGSNKDSAKAEAQKLLARAKKGEDFAALAAANSKDPGSAQQGGDLNFFGKGRMVPEFENAAFGAGVGDVVGPVETQFGFHVIKVTDRQTTELKFSQFVIKPSMSTATKQQIIVRAQKAVDEITAGTPFDSVAKKFEIPVQETKLFTADAPILSSRDLTAWAFDNEKGAAVRKDVKYYGMVVAQVSDTREAGIKPLDDMKEKITLTLRQKKKLDKLAQEAKSLAASFASDTTVSRTIQRGVKNNGSLTGFGGEYAATQAVFTAPAGTVTGPVRGERAWFVIKVVSRSDADMQQFAKDRPSVMQNMSTRARSQAFYAWFQTLRENSDIADLRNKRN